MCVIDICDIIMYINVTETINSVFIMSVSESVGSLTFTYDPNFGQEIGYLARCQHIYPWEK